MYKCCLTSLRKRLVEQVAKRKPTGWVAIRDQEEVWVREDSMCEYGWSRRNFWSYCVFYEDESWRAKRYMKVLRSEARPRANFELWQFKLTVVITAASLESDSGWILRQCKYIVFLRKFSVRAIVWEFLQNCKFCWSVWENVGSRCDDATTGKKLDFVGASLSLKKLCCRHLRSCWKLTEK